MNDDIQTGEIQTPKRNLDFSKEIVKPEPIKMHNFKGKSSRKDEILTPKPTMERRIEGLVQDSGKNVSGVNLQTIIVGLAAKLKGNLREIFRRITKDVPR